jgi:hypothetical protein
LTTIGTAARYDENEQSTPQLNDENDEDALGISEMIMRGWIAQAAIDRLYFVYGQIYVSLILSRIIKIIMEADRRARGGHP